MHSARSVIWLADVDTTSEHYGTQSRQLARMVQADFPLIPGFVISPYAYDKFINENHLDRKIQQLLTTISLERPDSLMQAEFHIKQLFQQALFSHELYDKITDFYFRLGNEVTLELFETGLHGRKHAAKDVTTEEGLICEVINLWSEMFSGNALWHRHHQKVKHFESKAEIIVRKKILADKTGSIFTIDPHSHAKDKLIIVTKYPHERDTYILSKKNLTILDRNLKHRHQGEKLTLDEIHAIAKLAKRVDEHLYFPQEIAWILAGNVLYIRKITPVTDFAVEEHEKQSRIPIARGKALTPAIGTGIVSIISDLKKFPPFISQTIIVIPQLQTKQLREVKKIRGIIIEDHPLDETAALLRLQGIPAICDVKHATKRFHNGHIVSIHGEKGEIYSGGILN